MNFKLNRAFFLFIVSLFLCGLFSSGSVLAQTSSTDVIMVDNSSTASAFASSSSSNEITPNNEIDLSDSISIMMQNLRIFGQNIGMSYVDPRTILARIIKSGMGFIGIIVLVIILWSGLRIMLSGGDEEKSAHAKRGLWNLLIGLFIMLSAYSIVSFVFNALNNPNSPPSTTESNSVTRDPVVNP